MPTFGRPEVAEQSLRNLRNQVTQLDSNFAQTAKFEIVVSINSDTTYSLTKFEKLADRVILREVNFGADINIALGFNFALERRWDYLWIVGDDEPLGEKSLELIVSIATRETPDLIVGTKINALLINNPRSFATLNEQTGWTLTFISSVIYKVIYTSRDVEAALRYSFTAYCHVVILNLLIAKKQIKSVVSIPIQDLVDYHFKVLQDPLKSRAEYGQRDSFVFFGKILASLATEDSSYIRKEFYKWWLANWHRVSMYLDSRDFRGYLLLGYSKRWLFLFPLRILSAFPYWRLKEKLKPVSLKR